MNLLDTASLVVTPNGYKASKLYSIIPSDGTGDMTFARTGDTATRVNSSGLIETVLANKPRLDYFNSTCPKLLLEPQRTNIVLQSNDLTTTWYNANASLLSNNIISPDGTQNADKILANTTNDFHVYQQTITVSSGIVYTMSLFVKSGEYTNIELSDSSSGKGNVFNLTNKTISNPQTGGVTSATSAKIEEYSNGWLKCSITYTTASTTAFFRISISNGTTTSFSGSASSGIYVYGAQLEAGAYATSYIPTTTASVTRNADTCEKTSATALIGQTEGTMFVNLEKTILNMGSGTTPVPLQISDATNNNRIFIGQVNNANKFQFYVIVGGVAQLNLQTIDFNLGKSKIAIGYKLNDFVIYVNGIQVYSSSSILIPTCSKINIGGIGATTEVVHPINSVALWKTRLQNSELATLTTI